MLLRSQPQRSMIPLRSETQLANSSSYLTLPPPRRLPRAYPFHLRVRDRSRLPLRQAKATRKRRTRRPRSVSLPPVSWVSLLMIYENDCRFMTKTRAACRDGDGRGQRERKYYETGRKKYCVRTREKTWPSRAVHAYYVCRKDEDKADRLSIRDRRGRI